MTYFFQVFHVLVPYRKKLWNSLKHFSETKLMAGLSKGRKIKFKFIYISERDNNQ